MKTNEFKAALCIGINNYHRAPLSACISDAEAMATLLNRHHDDLTPDWLLISVGKNYVKKLSNGWINPPITHYSTSLATDT